MFVPNESGNRSVLCVSKKSESKGIQGTSLRTISDDMGKLGFNDLISLGVTQW